jgi:hypothetical protein
LCPPARRTHASLPQQRLNFQKRSLMAKYKEITESTVKVLLEHA